MVNFDFLPGTDFAEREREFMRDQSYFIGPKAWRSPANPSLLTPGAPGHGDRDTTSPLGLPPSASSELISYCNITPQTSGGFL